jgi:hypothetical protein
MGFSGKILRTSGRTPAIFGHSHILLQTKSLTRSTSSPSFTLESGVKSMRLSKRTIASCANGAQSHGAQTGQGKRRSHEQPTKESKGCNTAKQPAAPESHFKKSVRPNEPRSAQPPVESEAYPTPDLSGSCSRTDQTTNVPPGNGSCLDNRFPPPIASTLTSRP